MKFANIPEKLDAVPKTTVPYIFKVLMEKQELSSTYFPNRYIICYYIFIQHQIFSEHLLGERYFLHAEERAGNKEEKKHPTPPGTSILIRGYNSLSENI